ncbi:MAG: histidine kinase [Verrucomicrobiales bacterium]|nr:histidine kinase [Verrucomicrobiales bacterium]
MQKTSNLKPVVLYAEDEDDARVLLTRAFLKGGVNAVELVQVNDGSEVVRYLSGEGQYADRTNFPLPHLLLLDLKMPRLSGFDVLEYLRKHPQFQTFPVVVFSFSDNEADVKKAHDLGCHFYVIKPGVFGTLVEFVKAIELECLAATRPEQGRGDSMISRFAVLPKKASPASFPAVGNASAPLVESSEIFRLLVAQVKDYAIFMLSPEGRVLSWNEGARRIKGYEPGEIIGKHFSTFYPQQDKENDKPQFELRMAKDMGRYEEEGWRVRKDGSRFWANVIITPMHGTDGKLIGFAKVTRDLTQRKLQEESLQNLLDTEERFRLLVDQVKDYAIFILDAKGNVNTWNQGARRLKGYTADEVIGRHFSIFYTPEDIARDHPAKELSLAIRDGRYEEEGWRVKKDGSRMWANVVITALWDKRGNLSGFAKVTRDLTEKKKEEDALRQKTEELESFAHTLSHDLRAPLRSIAGFAQILTTDMNQMSEQERTTCAQKIFNAAQRMEILIKDVLQLSELSLAHLLLEPVSSEEVVEECLSLLESQVQKTKARIEIKTPLPVIRANRTLLIQVFLNLISNALKFTRKNHAPKIQIYATRMQDGRCEIHVKDFGIGIPEPLHQSIFKPFERGVVDSDISGTGIGLAVVKKAVARIGGTVAVQSQEGEGSDFIVTVACEPASSLVAAGEN